MYISRLKHIWYVLFLSFYRFISSQHKMRIYRCERDRGISSSCENTYGDFAQPRRTYVIREKLLFDFEREPGASPSWNLVYMRIPHEHFSLRICFYNIVRCDSPRDFPLVFFRVLFVIPISIRFVVIIRREEKCENFTRCGWQRKRRIEEEWRVGKDVEWRSSSRNFKRYLVFLRPLKPPSTGLLCTFRLFKASRNTFLRKSRENRSTPRSTAADFGNKNIRERDH